MTAWDVDRAIGRIARRQHGVFSYRQARRAGATSRIIRRRLATGRWIELDSGVFGLPTSPGTWQRQCTAATLAIRGAAVSHATAAAVHQLAGFRQGRIHLVVPQGGDHRTRLATVHESSWPHITVVEGLRTVTMADTLFQIAGTTDSLRFRTAFEDAVVAHEWLLPTVFDRYVDLAYSRLPGIRVVRSLLEAHGDGAMPPHSELERLLHELLDRVVGLPARRCQAPLPGWEQAEARVDVLIEAWRLVVEADGRRWHTRVTDFERDRWRDNVATTNGYDVLRFTYHQLTRRLEEALALLQRYAATRQTAA